MMYINKKDHYHCSCWPGRVYRIEQAEGERPGICFVYEHNSIVGDITVDEIPYYFEPDHSAFDNALDKLLE